MVKKSIVLSVTPAFTPAHVTPRVADAHVARSVCRRAERRVVALSRVESIDSEIVKYLNRLSDLLFTTARLLSHISGTDEIEWKVAND